jgi:hypothetical protein
MDVWPPTSPDLSPSNIVINIKKLNAETESPHCLRTQGSHRHFHKNYTNIAPHLAIRVVH